MAGDLVFVGAQVAADLEGGVPAEARLLPGYPWHGSSIERQLDYIFRRLEPVLKGKRSSLQHVLKDNWFHTTPADINMAVRTRRKWLGSENPPPQTRVIVPELPVHGVSIMFDLIAIASDAEYPRAPVEMSKVPQIPYEQVYGWAGFSQAIRGGGFVFTRGMSPTDERGPLPQIIRHAQAFNRRIEQMRFQTHYELTRLQEILSEAGGSLNNVVRAEVHLVNMSDLAVLDEVWTEFFTDNPPIRVVIPTSLAIPDMIVEIELIAVDAAGPYRKEVLVASDVAGPMGHESQVVKAGPYVFFSPQLATDYRTGLAAEARPQPGFPFHESGTRLQVEYIQRNVQRLCAAAGIDVTMLVRRRAIHRDLSELPEAEDLWDSWLGPNAPPTTAYRASGPLSVPECTIEYDLIGYDGIVIR